MNLNQLLPPELWCQIIDYMEDDIGLTSLVLVDETFFDILDGHLSPMYRCLKNEKDFQIRCRRIENIIMNIKGLYKKLGRIKIILNDNYLGSVSEYETLVKLKKNAQIFDCIIIENVVETAEKHMIEMGQLNEKMKHMTTNQSRILRMLLDFFGNIRALMDEEKRKRFDGVKIAPLKEEKKKPRFPFQREYQFPFLRQDLRDRSIGLAEEMIDRNILINEDGSLASNELLF